MTFSLSGVLVMIVREIMVFLMTNILEHGVMNDLDDFKGKVVA